MDRRFCTSKFTFSPKNMPQFNKAHKSKHKYYISYLQLRYIKYHMHLTCYLFISNRNFIFHLKFYDFKMKIFQLSIVIVLIISAYSKPQTIEVILINCTIVTPWIVNRKPSHNGMSLVNHGLR